MIENHLEDIRRAWVEMDSIPGDNGTRLIVRHGARRKRTAWVILKGGVSVQIWRSIISVSIQRDDSWRIPWTGVAHTLPYISVVRNRRRWTFNCRRGKLNSSINMQIEGVVNRLVERKALRKLHSEGSVKIVIGVLSLVIDMSSTTRLIYVLKWNRAHAIRRNVERGRDWIWGSNK